MELNKQIINAVEEYQCPGCVCGSNTSCYEKGDSEACGKHVSGTHISHGIGKIFLGMPIGFNRVGRFESMGMQIFKDLQDGWDYGKFNVPVWKYLDENGNTIVRGISPRINAPFLHVFIGDYISDIDCLEITKEDIESMD